MIQKPRLQYKLCLLMSRIQSYKYNPIRRSTIIYPSQSMQGETQTNVLKSKIDYVNRIGHSSSIGIHKNNQKTYSQAQYNALIRRYQLQTDSLKQEITKQRQILQYKNQQYLTQLLQILNFVYKNTTAIDQYFKFQKIQKQPIGKDLQRQYQYIKEKIQQQRKRNGITSKLGFSQMKKSIINPQNIKQKSKLLCIKNIYSLKITPQKEWITFNHNTSKSTSIDSQKERHKVSFKKEQTPEKHRNTQQKVKILQQVISHSNSKKIQNDCLIEQLNEQVIKDELQLLNLKMKNKYGVFY